MAAEIPPGSFDPYAPDVEGDAYDPKYDLDKDGGHNKTENDSRGQKKEETEKEKQSDTYVEVDEVTGEQREIKKPK